MIKKTSIIAGGAGFIGVNLIRKLLEYKNNNIVVIDNYCRGSIENLKPFKDLDRVDIFEADLSNQKSIINIFNKVVLLGEIDEVWHLAANSDIPAGVLNPDIDYKDTFKTTYQLLKVMKEFKVKRFHFASSSAVYGDLGDTILHEEIGPLLPISNYGAMKLASEAQASAARECFLDQVNIFRFPNVVGVPATHGVILDFVKKLSKNKDYLGVLGNGTQQKSYLHVSDLIEAMFVVINQSKQYGLELVNIGPIDTGASVKWIAEKVVDKTGLDAKIIYGKGNQGWVGDVPKFNYSIDKIKSFGWLPKLNSEQAIEKAIDEIILQENI